MLKKNIKISKMKFRMLVGSDKKKYMFLSPTLSQYGLKLNDFLSLFDKKNFFFFDGFLIDCIFDVVDTKILNLVLMEPSCSFFFKYVYLYKNIDKILKVDLLKLVFIISIFKSNRYCLGYLSLFVLCKNILSTIKSYTSGDNRKIKNILYV